MGRLQIDPEEWAAFTKLLDGALDLPAGAREQWLEDLDSRYEPLKPHLRTLLSQAARVETSDFLETLPKLDPSGLETDSDMTCVESGRAEDRVGPYRLLRELGSGGMGVVWLAERADRFISRPVALKCLRGRWMRAGLRERMAREREILASLEHAGIARLYDAGLTEAGDPYLALEYVEGEPLDAYCSERALGIDARLRLFLQVADAVAYAHSKLIIHRDLKPANILVTKSGDVRLLDFGIGKLLDEQQARGERLTELSGQALTPDYASPEQIAGLPLTVGTDVYSLGIVLYELLSEERPYRLKRDSRGALEEAILEVDPPRPSRVVARREWQAQLAGDLDAITLKALKKKAQERYASVGDFAADIRRHLRNEPVLARPDTVAYRARKFVRRHRAAVLAASAVGIALPAAMIVTALQSIEARRQRDAAIYQQQRVQATNEFLNLLLGELGPSGEPLTLVELLDRGVALLDRQSGAEERFVARMLYEVSILYATLGKTDTQRELLERAATLAGDLDDRQLLATVRCAQARAEFSAAPRAAETSAAEGRRILALLDSPPLDGVIECHRADAMLLEGRGDHEGAVERLRAALAAVESSPLPSTSERVLVLNDLAEQLYKTDRVSEALTSLDHILQLMELGGLSGTLSNVIYLLNRAAILARMGEVTTAAGDQERALSNLRALSQPLIGAIGHYGTSLLRLARYDEALALFREGREEAEVSGNARWSAQYQLQIGIALARSGRGEEAEPYLADAERVFQQTPDANRRLLNELALARVEILRGRGNLFGARQVVDAVLHDLGYPGDLNAAGLWSALSMAGMLALAASDHDSAERLASDALLVATSLARDPARSGDVGTSLLLRGQARLALGNTAAAYADLNRALDALMHGFGADHPHTRDARALLEAPGTIF